MKRAFSAALTLGLFSSAAHAITVDGTISLGEYAGAITTLVPYQANAIENSFNSNQGSNTTAYTVFYTSDANNVFIGLQTNQTGPGLDNYDRTINEGLVFTNLYFSGLIGAPGSVGFEVFNDRAFKPGGTPGVYYPGLAAAGGQYQRTIGTTYANGGAPSTIEVSIPWTVFTQNTLNVGQGFTGIQPGGDLRLTISQSFGYTPSLGDSLQPDPIIRFGTLQAPGGSSAVPEPATWGMMLIGFGIVGVTARRRRSIPALA